MFEERKEDLPRREWEPTGERILITGFSGLVGSGIARVALGKDTIFGLARGKTTSPFEEHQLPIYNLDLFDKESLFSVLEEAKPTLVLHLAALTNVDYCQDDPIEAFDTNALATAGLAHICYEMGIPIGYCSTDYVFPRTGGPFVESDEPNPLRDAKGGVLNCYGLTKLFGERMLEVYPPGSYFIFRIASPYDFSYPQKPGTPPVIYQRLKEGLPLKVVTDAKTTYTWVPDIARALNRLILKRAWEDKNPVYHIAGPDWLSAKDIVDLCLERLGRSSSEIVETTLDEYFKGRAPRPLEGGLGTERITNMGSAMHSLREVLSKVV